MELIVIVTDSEPAYFYVRGASFNSGGYILPVYVAGNGVLNVKVLVVGSYADTYE